MTVVEISDDLFNLLQQSQLREHAQGEQVQVALAMYLAQEGVISVGKAAEMTGKSRSVFEQLMADLGFHPVQYDVADLDIDSHGFAEAEQRSTSS